MSADAKKMLIDTLGFVQHITRELVKEFPEGRLTFRACPTDNPVIWSVGHLASVNDWFSSLIDGQPVEFPKEWNTSCGYKSTPSAELSVYPEFAKVRAALDKSHARLIGAVRAQSSEDLAKPTQFESNGIAPTRADAAARAAWHEGWHGGQIAAVRKAVGLPSVM
jgi:hypothetical protein